MALIVTGIIAVSAGIGSLLTYSGVKYFSDSPTTTHVQTIVQNQIAAHIDADNNHETFQNNIISLIIGAVAVAGVLMVVRYAVIGIRASRRNNDNNKSNNMHAINIEA